MSPKDRAFERERAASRQAIRTLERENRKLHETIDRLTENIDEQQQRIRLLEDWNTRLLAYLDLDEADFRRILASEKQKAELTERFRAFADLFDCLDRMPF